MNSQVNQAKAQMLSALKAHNVPLDHIINIGNMARKAITDTTLLVKFQKELTRMGYPEQSHIGAIASIVTAGKLAEQMKKDNHG